MAKVRRAERDKYGEPKKQFQFMLTETASEQLDRLADKLDVSRSEIVEKFIRESVGNSTVAS